MKLVDHFRLFLIDTVNINETRLELLESSLDAIKGFIAGSDWKPTPQSFMKQGSWAHETIIKPVEGKAFDADLLVMVEHVDGWTAKQYISTLRTIFAKSATYEDKVKRSSHCITIEYAGYRRIDIAPCVVGRLYASSHEVCNGNEDTFQASEPAAYTLWFNDRNAWTRNNALRKVTRLLKYLRDIKGTFTCASFLFTTLVGYRVSELDAANDTDFVDVPTALQTIVRRLDEWLQYHPTKPVVYNPVLASEVISDLWTDEQYENFRETVHRYRDWIDDAFEENELDESIGKWRRVFGEDFAKSVAIGKAARVTEAARIVLSSAGTLLSLAGEDLVGLFSRLGRAALPPGFDALPHKVRPRWKRAKHGMLAARVSATLHRTKGGPADRGVASGEGLLPKGWWLRFVVSTADGFGFGSDYDVHWRIANTDREAHEADCLRGGFEWANDGHDHWETLAYRGVHTAEAFIVRRKDKMLVAQSVPFYVVVE